MNERKKQLRREMKEIRAGVTERREREERALTALKESGLLEYEKFFVYRAFGTEAPTEKMISYLKEENKEVYSPRVEGDTMVAVKDCERYEKSAFGIWEPVGEAYGGSIDVCILPLLAVDEQGVRLGYGGGYYDKFLKERACVKVAYGYFEQVLPEVPSETFDVKADAILTEEGIVWIHKEKK